MFDDPDHAFDLDIPKLVPGRRYLIQLAEDQEGKRVKWWKIGDESSYAVPDPEKELKSEVRANLPKSNQNSPLYLLLWSFRK